MSDFGHPVTVAVQRYDGSIEQVRVGTAYPEGDGFRLELGELRIGGAPAPRPAASGGWSSNAQARGGSGAGGGQDGGMRFPNYGRSKNAPIIGATEQDLEYYANGARRSLADPSKARWHDKERALLAAIEAELARQRGGGSGGGEEPGGGAYSDDEPPPHSDEDAPF